MLVDPPGRGNALFERVERSEEKSSQMQEPFGTAIGVGTRFEAPGEQTIERLYAAAAPAEFIVERQHFHDQPRAKRKRRGQALILSVEGGSSKDDLPLDFAQERWSIAALGMQTFVQFVARNEIRKQHRSRAGKTPRRNRLAKRFGSAPGWDDDRRRPRVGRTHTADEVGLHPLQVRHPHKAGGEWGDHRFEGGVVSRSSSSPAF